MYMCVGLCERMSYDMYCTCIIDTRRLKSALPIKTCWILWIPNPLTLFCLSTSPLFVYCLSRKTMKRGGGGWAEAQSNCNIRIKQHEWHAASVWLRRVKRATRWLSSFLFTGLMCPVRQSQSRHFVSGCHIKLCSARSVTGDCLCVRMCVCVKPPWVYFRCFLNAVSCCRGKQGWQSSGSALISPSQEGHHSPFLPLPPTCTHTHTKKPRNTRTNTRMCLCNLDTLTLPQEAAVSAADFHAFKSIPLWSMILGREYVCEWVKRCVSVCVCLFRRVISLGTVDSAGVVTETKLEIHGFRIQ